MTLGNILLEILWFMALFAWIWLLIMILNDIFRDHELPGWGKALWTLALIVLPWLGALVYLVVRGGSMQERAAAQAARNEEAFRRRVQETAAEGKPSTADELVKLAGLRDRGAISAEDYDRAKTLVLTDERMPVAISEHQRSASHTT